MAHEFTKYGAASLFLLLFGESFSRLADCVLWEDLLLTFELSGCQQQRDPCLFVWLWLWPIVQSAAHHNGAGQPNTNAPLYISTFYLHFNLTWSQQKASLIKFLIKNTKQHRKFNKMSPLTLLGWYTLVWQSLNPPEISIPAIQPDSRIFCFHCRRAMPQSILCVSSRHIQGGCIFNQLSQSHWLNMGVNGHCLHSLFPTTISFVAFLHIVMLNI